MTSELAAEPRRWSNTNLVRDLVRRSATEAAVIHHDQAGDLMDVQELIDKHEIVELQTRYSLSLDRRDYDDLDEVFLADATGDYGHAGFHTNVEGIKQACRDALDATTSSQHQNGNHWAEIDGDRARAGCYFTVHLYRENTPGGDHFSMGGTYVDDLVRTGDGWRITKRVLRLNWSDGNPEVRYDR